MRRGFTLIELLAVMTIASVIFSVLGMSIFALHRTQTRVQNDAHTAATLAELARRLRADAHAATAVSPDAAEADAEAADGGGLVLEYDNGRRVIYEFDSAGHRIQRRVTEGEKVVHRDSFVLPRGAEVRWTMPEEDEPPLAAVVISRPRGREKAAADSPRRTRIEAVVGLDRRYVHGETSR